MTSPRTNARRWQALLAGSALAALAALTSGCGHSSIASTPKQEAGATQTVETLKPVRHTFRRTVEQPGQVEPFEQTPIYANITGYVGEVRVDMDARVKKDQVLAWLSVPEMDDEVKQKEAMVVQARAELEQERKALLTAEANLATSKARILEAIASRKRAQAQCERWESESRRMAVMVARKVIDEQTLDEARNEHRAAQAACEETEAKIASAQASRDESAARRDKLRADIDAAAARLRVAEANERRMRTLLGYAEVKAPFAGIVTRRNVHTGHLLKPGTNGKAEPLFVVIRMDRVRVFVDVPEADAGLVRPGMPVRVRIQALNDREIEATVTRTSWALDPSSRTLRAEVELPNPGEELRPGMYAYASFTAQRSTTWAVPVSAIVKKDDSAFCCLVSAGKVVRTPVRLGAQSGSLVEVLKKRLPPEAPGQAGRWQDFRGDEVV
ncbi:MAG TPA: efflux RND transporter periplasmic adaptor subunit, partial [Reyranella sp.]